MITVPDAVWDGEIKNTTDLTQEEDLDRQLQPLPVDLRELLVLRFYQDLPFDVIADMNGLSESAVKMRIYRGLEKLKILLLNSEG